VTYVVTQADVDAGQIVNTGTADSDQTAPVTDPETVPVPQAPALTLDKVLTANADEDASGTVSLGDTLSYSLTATNSGDVTLTAVTVADDLTGDATSCLALAPGADCVLTVTYVVTQADVDAGQIVNTGTADSDQTAPVTDPETVPVPQAPSLGLTKTASPASFSDVGDVISYTITATNTGDVTLTDVAIVDTMEGRELDTFECSPSVPAATLAPGASIVCRGTYVIRPADLDGGDLRNTATATSEEVGIVVAGAVARNAVRLPATDLLAPPISASPGGQAAGTSDLSGSRSWVILAALLIMSAGWVVRRERRVIRR
jgi:uncharacterized repeat protein (TIGR01451 family)